MTTTLDKLRDEYERLGKRRLAEMETRFEQLVALKKRCDDEMLVLADEIENFRTPTAQRPRRSRLKEPECGTESGYQSHRHRGEKCEACKGAHREHERIASARRRLRKLAASA